MTLTLERLGHNVYGFSGLGQNGDGSDDTDVPDDSSQLLTLLNSLPSGGGPSALGTSITCGAGEVNVGNVCVPVGSTTNTAAATALINQCGAGYIQDDYGNCVLPGGSSTSTAAATGSQYYSTSGQLIKPGTGSSSGTYQVLNPVTGAVLSTVAGALPSVGNVNTSSQLISGVSNTTLMLGAAVALVFLIAISQR